MTEMKKHIYDENSGLWYELIGDYYIPSLALPSEGQHPIGKWGRLHRDYLKEHRPIIFNDLILSGQFWSYLTNLDEQKELFSEHTDCVREYQTITDCMLFQNVFKLRARMILEVMD